MASIGIDGDSHGMTLGVSSRVHKAYRASGEVGLFRAGEFMVVIKSNITDEKMPTAGISHEKGHGVS